MKIDEMEAHAPRSLLQALRPFINALMTPKMRSEVQEVADNYLRAKIIKASGVTLHGDLVSVLVGHDDSLVVYLKNRSAVAPLRRAGFKLAPFRLRNGRVEPATSSTADGWEINEGTEQ